MKQKSNESTRIGGLWSRTDINGNTYYTGKINIDGHEIAIKIFRDNNRQDEKQPEFIIHQKLETSGVAI
jgi:hypothetical protein